MDFVDRWTSQTNEHHGQVTLLIGECQRQVDIRNREKKRNSANKRGKGLILIPRINKNK